jgi:hypothetical protein
MTTTWWRFVRTVRPASSTALEEMRAPANHSDGIKFERRHRYGMLSRLPVPYRN